VVGLLVRSRYRRILCALVAIAGLLLWLLGGSVSGAIAAGTPLAQLPNAAQKLTAYDGYVVFSQYEPSARDWHLMVWHSGSIGPLPVPAQDPPPPTANELQSSEYLREPVWTDARGCRIYELALPNGSPKLVKGIYKSGASDSTPAIWDGDIAFARLGRRQRRSGLRGRR
jgi:hypothetical protein